MTNPKEDQQPMTTREELVALADEAAKRNAAHRDETGDMLFLGRPDDFLTSVEDALRRLASRQEVSVGELAGFFATEFPPLMTMSTQIEVARALLAKYSITKRTTEG